MISRPESEGAAGHLAEQISPTARYLPQLRDRGVHVQRVPARVLARGDPQRTDSKRTRSR